MQHALKCAWVSAFASAWESSWAIAFSSPKVPRVCACALDYGFEKACCFVCYKVSIHHALKEFFWVSIYDKNKGT